MSASSRFAELLRLIEERVRRRVVFASLHPYRIVSQNGDRLNLQAVSEREALLPQLVEVEPAHGLQGVKQTCRTRALVLVGFQGGSPGAPFVAHYFPAQPLEVEIDAQDDVRIGPGAAVVHLAGGSDALALGAPVTALASALSAFALSASTAINVAQIAAAAGVLKTALEAIPPYATTKVQGV